MVCKAVVIHSLQGRIGIRNFGVQNKPMMEEMGSRTDAYKPPVRLNVADPRTQPDTHCMHRRR
jgi:hypothetical protein